MRLRLPQFRFSLLGLMALVAYAAVGCAALRYSTDLWASSIFTLAVLAQMIAVLCIALRREQTRAAWIGFLVFGGGYLLLVTGLAPQTDLITARGLAWLEQKLHPAVTSEFSLTTSSPPSIAYSINSNSPVATLTTSRMLLLNAVNGQQIASPSQTPFLRIGHGLLSPLMGLIGAWIAAWLYTTGRKPTNLRGSA